MKRSSSLLFIFLILLLSSKTFSQEFTQSNLPIIIIETNGQIIPDEPKINVDMGIIYNGPGQINYIDDPFNDYDGIVGIEKRGSTSQWFFPKKQYAFETRDDSGNNLNVSLLGLPEENDWILHAPYSDKTLLRNVLTYKLSAEMGNYSSRTMYCEVVINGDYKGVYVLMEKIKQDNKRVDITEMDEDDLQGDSLTGGYIIKIDKSEGAYTQGWYSTFPPYPGAWQEIRYQYHYPKPANIQLAQKQYIQQVIYDFEAVMYSNNFNNPETGYPSIIDVNSFVDLIIINELTKNVDGYRLSTYLHKDRDSKNGKLKAGPVWDYNITLGNANYYGGFDPEGWMITGQYSFGDDFTLPFWWEKLMTDPAFFQTLVLRWNIFRKTILHTETLLNYIENSVTILDEAQQRNFERWPILGEHIWPNYFVGDTYEEEVEYMTVWLLNRLAWMDEELKLQPIINEINYNSSPNIDPGDWIELYNPTNQNVNISGWKLKDGNDIYFDFPSASYLPPDSYLIICEDINQFLSVFPDVENVIGNLQTSLDNQEANIELYNSSDFCVDMLSYSNQLPWPDGANGTGNTIELIYYLTDNSKGESWQLCAQSAGSPGMENSVSLVPSLYINEFMADNESTIMDEYGDFDDWIEVYNSSDSPVNIGGKYITDNLNIPLKFQIPNTEPLITTILPGEFLLLWADKEPNEGVLHLDFKLSKEQEQIGLFLADGITFVDSISFGQQESNLSYGRLTDGGEQWIYFEFPTPGTSNSIATKVTDEEQKNIVVYPNPAYNTVYINLPDNKLSNLRIVVFSLLGEKMIEKKIRTQFVKLGVEDLPPGIYTVIIERGSDKLINKFIKL